MKKLLSAILAMIMVFSIAVIPVQAAQKSDFPMNVRVFVTEDQFEEVADLSNQGFDFIYQSGVDEIDGEYFLTFLVWSQEELDYFNNNGYKIEITHKNSDVSIARAATFSTTVANTENSAIHYTVDAEGYIVGISGGNTYPLQPAALRTDPGEIMFDPTGVSFNETYGFPNRKGYRSVEEYYGEMFYLAETYPDIVKIHHIGNSWYNPIYALEICNAPGVEDGRPEWMDLAAQHSREWPANELVMNTAWWLVTQYDKYQKGDTTVEPGIIEVMESIRTWCLPMYNPDGTWMDQTTSQYAAGNWRANARPGTSYVTSYNEVIQDYAYGTSAGETGRFYVTGSTAGTANYPVDLNRNFSYRWGSSDGSSNQTAGQGQSTTRGPTPLSEPENQALASLVARRMIGSDYSGHTYGGLVIYPWDNKKSLAVTKNMNFEELGRILWSYNDYNDYHERVIYSQSGEGQGFLFGSWRSLGFTYEMGYNYNSASQVNFVPPYLGDTSYWKVAVANYQNKNPNITTLVSQPEGELVAPAGTQVIPLHYRTSAAAGTGQITEEVTAPVYVMMPECVTNEHNLTNCGKDVYGNPTPGECEYHSVFQTTYTTNDLLATTARFNALLALDPALVNGKILVCYSASTADESTELVLAAQGAGAKGVIFAQIGNQNNANSAHTMTDGNLRLTADSRIVIPVALTPRPFARDIHEHDKEEEVILTLQPNAVPWNTQMMEWERNCYSFLELAKFAKDYSGHITGTVTDGNGNVADGAKLDLSLDVLAPILREGVRDVFWWNLSDYNATTNPNGITATSKANFGDLLKTYTHPVNGDQFVVREFTHTSYIDVFGADGSFDWSVVPSAQFDTYAYEGLRQPATPTTAGGNGARGTVGGFETDSPDDPRNGTYLFPNDGYTVTATANGAYSHIKQVVVEEYKVTVDDVDFVVPAAITSDFTFDSVTDAAQNVTVYFSTYRLDAASRTSVKGNLNGVYATVNGMPVTVTSLGDGNYSATFNLAKLRVSLEEAYLVIDFASTVAHSPLTIGEVPDSEGNLSLTTNAHRVTDGTYFTLNAAFTEEVNSNTAILNYTFDADLFAYANFTAADGVTVVDTQYDNTLGTAKITVMIQDGYGITDLGDIMLLAKDGQTLSMQTVSVVAEYVVKGADNIKVIKTAGDSASFLTIGKDVIEGLDTNFDGVLDLLDLSNMIDWFGLGAANFGDEWNYGFTYSRFDINHDGYIGIFDIAHVAQKI